MPTRIYLAEILQVVAKRYGMTVEELRTPSMAPEYFEPRQVAAYLCRQLTAASFGAISKHVGYTYRSSSANAVKTVELKRSSSADFDALIIQLIAELAAMKAA